MTSPLQLHTLAFRLKVVLLAAFVCLLCSHPAFSQTPFTKTYSLGGNIQVACCASGQFYGFTPVIQDTSLSGNVQITSISVSDIGTISATDPNGIAGTTWEIFAGPSSCGFPVGQLQGSISLSTYSCSAPTQLVFNTNGTFVAPQTGLFSASYNFATSTFTANDIGAFVSASNSPSNLTQGLSLQVLLWSGDVGANLVLNNISLTVTGTAGSVGATVGEIQTVAGGVPNNVQATSISVGFPTAVVKDSSGNVYVAAESVAGLSSEIFKIDANGTLTTIAGDGGIYATSITNNGDGGLATNASFGYISGLFLDSQQNLYLSDILYNTVRKINTSTGIITTVAGGGTGCGNTSAIGDGCSATSAVLSAPYQVFVDTNLNLYIADSGNTRIREVVASTGLIQTLAGGGLGCTAQTDTIGDGCVATQASLSGPTGVYLDANLNIFISDTQNNRVREISASTGLIQTVAGTGVLGYSGDGIAANTANVAAPSGLFVDSSRNVFFADSGNARIREVVASSGLIQSVAGGGPFGCTGQTDPAGDGCPASNGSLVDPLGVFVDSSTNIYLADFGNHSLREVFASTGLIQRIAGNGNFFSGDGQPAINSELALPYGLTSDAAGNFFVTDIYNLRVRKVSAATDIIETVAGGAPGGAAGNGCAAQTDTLGDGCPATQAILGDPFAVAVDKSDNLYIADYINGRIRMVSASTGIITTAVGGGTGCTNQTDAVGDNCPGPNAILGLPWGVYVDPNGNIFFTDYSNARVRELVAATGLVQTIAGTGTAGYNGDNIPATQAEVNLPVGIHGDASGNIFISEVGSYRIREIVASTGNIITVAGTGTPGYNGDNISATTAQIGVPYGLYVDVGGNLFFADTVFGRVREVVASTGIIQTVAGNGTLGFSGDGGPATSAEVSLVFDVSGDAHGNLFLADTYNNRVREVFGVVPANVLATTSNSVPAGTVGVPYSFGLQAVGGTAPYSWTLTGGSLPPGFNALPTTGVISGTSTTAGTYGFTVVVTDSSVPAETATVTISLTIAAAPPTLLSIAIAPTNPTISTNAIQTFLAIGTYSDGSTQNLTSAVTWSTGTSTVATITTAGVATGVLAGTSTITATSGNIFGSTTLTVTANAPHAYIGSGVSPNCCLDVLDLSTNQVVSTIPITRINEPFGITPDQSRVYVADNVSNLVNVIDTTTNTLMTTIATGLSPTEVAITPNGQSGYVATFGETNVSVFNVATNTTTAAIPVGFTPYWVTVTPDGSSVYVTATSANSVAVINTSTNTVSSTFTIAAPAGLPTPSCLSNPIFNLTGSVVYILQQPDCGTSPLTASAFVNVISLPGNTPVTTIPVGIGAFGSALSPDGTRLYVTNDTSNTVAVINTATNTVITTVTVGVTPFSLAFTPDGTRLYVTNTGDNTLSIIQTSTNTVSSTIPLTSPFGVTIASPPPASAATVLTLTPPSLLFGSQIAGTSGAAQTISVTNPGTAPVTLTSIALTGPASTSYTLVNGCPVPPAILAGGASCNLQLTFAPATTGVLTALVTINSTNGLAALTQSAPLNGRGTGSTVPIFSALTPSQAIAAGTASINLSGVIGNGTIFPVAGEIVFISINGVTKTSAIGTNGAFSATFTTSTIPASATPYPIVYSYRGNATLTAASDSSTTLTVNSLTTFQTLTVTDIGTGNGTVTDNAALISCTDTAGVQSGTCSASYATGTVVTLTATASSPSTFAAWGGACTGTGTCSVTMTTAQVVTASFAPPPQQISLTFSPGSNVSGMATYDCPSNPAPSPANPCTDPNAHALALMIPQVLQPFTVTVQASELAPSVANGICPNGATPSTNFNCRFTSFFTYQTLANGDRVVPLCYPYANGNCVHYQVFSGTPGVEPNPSFYVGPIDWNITWNKDTFVPPAPYTGSTPRLYDDPDYAVSVTAPYGTDCTTPMLVGNPPVATNPPIYCQFEFDITTSYNPTKKVDAGITGRTRQFNDVTVAFPPANVGNLTVTEAPLATPVVAGNPIGYTITVTNSAGGAVTGATLTDVLPAGTNVNWTISPAFVGPGACAIAGTVGSQSLSCAFGTIAASQSFTIGLLSASSSIGTYTDAGTLVIGNQQILTIGTVTVTPATLVSITVTPANPSLTVGTTQQFTATGLYSDGTTQNLTTTATWLSSATTVATISSTGLATIVGTGPTTITATSGGISSLTVNSGSAVTYLDSGLVSTDFPSAFTAANFASAQTGPAASVLTSTPAYVGSLVNGPGAVWIGTNSSAGAGTGDTALYAISFNLPSTVLSGSLNLYYAVDNVLGLSNPGIYINGTALPNSTALLCSLCTTSFTQENLYTDASIGPLLVSGTNWLYLDGVNQGAAAGLIFSANFTFTSASGSATGSTVLTGTATLSTLTVTDIGTGNGTVTDATGLISCTTTAGVQSGNCSATYSAGAVVTLTATPSSPSTFGGWGGACTGTAGCSVTMTTSQSVTASFVPPPQQISVTINPGTGSSGMATYNCPGNPSPSPTNPCTAPNAHSVALTIGQVLQPITVTVQASEVPPSVDNGICPNGATPSTNFACRFTSFFTYQTLANGDRVVPLCYPYANGNCVHYQVFSGTPGVEPNPSFYVGPVDWMVTWNNDKFTPPAPYTGSTPRLYDDPDYAVSPTSPYGTDCTTPMLVGNPPVATNPPIYCQFEFDITTSYNPTKPVDAGITGRTRQFNDVVVAFPPATVGNLTVTEAPVATPVTPGSPIGFTISITDSAVGPVTGATLTDVLPSGTNVNWTISPAYTGPGTCTISGAVGSQILSCAFGTISASQTFTIGLQSPSSSIGTYTDTATIVVGTQQILSIGTLSVQGSAAFSVLTPSQTITAGTVSINLSGTIGSGTSYPAAGETVSISINGVTQTATIGSSGAFSATFATATISASTTPYTITYSYAGDPNFTSASNTSTTLTVNPPSSLVISPASVDLGQVPLGGFFFKKVILSNTGTTGITFSKIAMGTTGTGEMNDFSVVNLCPKVLAAKGSCAIIVAYVPDRDDPLMTTSTASVLITDNAGGSPQSVPLTAQTINPSPKLNEDELEFGGQKVGTTSNTQKVTLTNVGTTPLILGTVSITGDFALAPGTSCGAGTSLNPSQSCVLVVDFTPTKTGNRYGDLTITDNALLNKLSIELSGTGR